MARVLLVDDEPDFVAAASELLRHQSHEVAAVGTLAAARSELDERPTDVVLLDLMLPDGNGLELLPELSRRVLKKVVLVTGHSGVKAHIKHLSGPNVSYLTKPVGGRELARLLHDVEGGPYRGGEDAPAQAHFGLIVGEHPLMQAVYETIERVACTDTPVFIVGETGTGKELIAESIHRASGVTGEFVVANCGSLTAELAGSELFGHEKGSFTGAVRRHVGFFERASEGTLFLDELTEMPLTLQPHFLRVIETNRVLPVGAERESKVTARIVAATNRQPESAIEDGALRQDLYFRLNAFPIRVPPLRERLSDIPLLAESFLRELDVRQERPRRFSEAALRRMKQYHWPGNVRELRHVVQRACILSDPAAAEVGLPSRFGSPFPDASAHSRLEAGRSIRDVERELIECTLAHFNGDKKATAAMLGISLNTLYNRLNSYATSESTR